MELRTILTNFDSDPKHCPMGWMFCVRLGSVMATATVRRRMRKRTRKERRSSGQLPLTRSPASAAQSAAAGSSAAPTTSARCATSTATATTIVGTTATSRRTATIAYNSSDTITAATSPPPTAAVRSRNFSAAPTACACHASDAVTDAMIAAIFRTRWVVGGRRPAFRPRSTRPSGQQRQSVRLAMWRLRTGRAANPTAPSSPRSCSRTATTSAWWTCRATRKSLPRISPMLLL